MDAIRAPNHERRQAMEYSAETVLGLVKTRMNRLQSDTSLDDYLLTLMDAAKERLGENGITLRTDSANDAMLLVDMTVWNYQNRDSVNAMPPWLAQYRRERWFADKKKGGAEK